MIRRAPYRTHYVQVDNRAVEDDRLSLRAKGLLVYLLSRPPNWCANPTHVATTTSDSVGIIRSCLQELKRFGYATLQPLGSGGRGNMRGTEWVIDELPGIEIPVLRDSTFASFEKELPLTNTEGKTKTEKIYFGDQAEQIWKTYPRRAGKPAAIAAIKRAIKRHGFDKIMTATKAFAAARPNKNDSFTPWPQKWFNQERYNDDPATWVSAPKSLTAVERNKRKGQLQDDLNSMFRNAKARQKPGQPLYSEAETQQRDRMRKELAQL